jgi:hypothetical protein
MIAPIRIQHSRDDKPVAQAGEASGEGLHNPLQSTNLGRRHYVEDCHEMLT